MSRLVILRYPDQRLKRIAKPVTEFGQDLKKLVDDMAETMYEAPGVGLAAPQVNINKQIIILDASKNKDDLHIFINPQIISTSPEKDIFEEGCLSLPGIYEKIERPGSVTVQALDIEGNPFELQAEGFMAVCLQHEIDHLHGFVFVDYLSPMKRNRIKSKLLKGEREMRRSPQQKMRQKK